MLFTFKILNIDDPIQYEVIYNKYFICFESAYSNNLFYFYTKVSH